MSKKNNQISRKEQAFFRFLAGQSLHVEPMYGVQEFEKVLLISELQNSSEENICQAEKDKTQQIHIYSSDGNLIGNYSNLDEIPKNSVAVIGMSGVMMNQDAMCSYGMKSMDKNLRKLYSDNKIKGIIMDIDTGGGQSTAGDILFNAIQDRNKPVIIHTTLLASAGIKGTLAADEIIAASTSTLVGSIGTMMTMPKWYIEDKKENNIELYSETSDGKNSAWRALKNGNFQPYIDQLTKNDEMFMKQVRKYRPLKGTPNERKKTLDGSVFSASEAKTRGLVDGIGSLNYAIKRLNSHLSYFKK